MESDLSLIKKIKSENNEVSLTELIERHSGIYVYIVDQFSRNGNPLLDKHLMLEDKDYVIYKSALNFDPTINIKFSTYLANEARWKCLNYINKQKRLKESSLEDVNFDAAQEETPFDNLSKMEAYDLFYKTLEKEKDERIKKIIDIRYNTDNNKLVPWRVVANKLNMSIQGCINIEKKFLNKIKQEINKHV